MTEKERREDEALRNCIQEAYGLSDEQLLAELDELEASLSDDEFVGAEDRIYARIMQREAEREESSVSVEETATSAEIPTSKPTPIRKISKKKKWLVVGIAAALVVGASVSTIGGYNTFLRKYEEEKGVVLDSGKNVIGIGKLEEAYKEVENKLNIDVLKLNYIPLGLTFEKISFLNNRAAFEFSYDNRIIYFIQEREEKEVSKGFQSDRKKTDRFIKNKWLNTDIAIEENVLEDSKVEYSVTIHLENASYRIFGILPEEELISIVENLGF